MAVALEAGVERPGPTELSSTPPPTGVEVVLFQRRVETNIQLAQHIARKEFYSANYVPPSLDLDDFIGAANEGLVQAGINFRDIGVPFEAYASHRIAGAVRDQLREADLLPRSARARAAAIDGIIFEYRKTNDGKTPSDEYIAQQLSLKQKQIDDARSAGESGLTVSLDALAEPIDDDDKPSWLQDKLSDPNNGPEAILLDKELIERVKRATRLLDKRERVIIALHYSKELPFAHIGVMFDISETRVSQIHKRAARKLREILTDDTLTPDDYENLRSVEELTGRKASARYYRDIAAGKIPGRRLGGQWYTTKEALKKFKRKLCSSTVKQK